MTIKKPNPPMAPIAFARAVATNRLQRTDESLPSHTSHWQFLKANKWGPNRDNVDYVFRNLKSGITLVVPAHEEQDEIRKPL